MLAFDVNGTLSDLKPLAGRLSDIGAPAHLLQTWVASTLRDGIGLAAAGAYGAFIDVARGTLTSLLSDVDGLNRPADEATDYVVAGFEELPVHPDVPPAVNELHATGLRLVTLTNGSPSTTKSLLVRARVAEFFEQLLSVEAVKRWKPSRDAYDYAVRMVTVSRPSVMLVAVHPWDIDGAKRAGLSTCWVNRGQLTYPGHLMPPDLEVSAMTELVAVLRPAAGYEW